MGKEEATFAAIEEALSNASLREQLGRLLGRKVARRKFFQGVAAAGAAASAVGALGFAPDARAGLEPAQAGVAASAVRKPSVASNVAEAVVEGYIANGVKYMWINGGTDTPPIQEAIVSLADKGEPAPTIINALHEHFGLSAAHGYYMVTGRPQVMQVHVELGTQNVGGALHNAYRGYAGVVLAAGRTPYTTGGEMAGSRSSSIHWIQEVRDQGEIVRQYTKWDYELARGENVHQVIQRAFQIASTPPAGPVYLVYPREVLLLPAPESNGVSADRYRPASPAHIDPGELREAARLLAKAEFPLIITEFSGRNPEAVAPLVQLAEVLGAPVFSGSTRMNFPTTHPLYLRGGLATYFKRADVVLVLDSNVPYIPSSTTRPRDDARTIQIDFDPVKQAIPVWGFPVDLPITADTASSLPSLVAAIQSAMNGADRARAQQRRAEIEAAHQAEARQTLAAAQAASTARPISPLWVGYVLSQLVDADTVFVNEALSSGTAMNVIERTRPGTLFGSGGSSLGWGPAAAFGAKLALPDATVVNLEADGSFIFSAPTAVYWAAERYKVPFLTVVFNNGGYNAVKSAWRSLFPNGVAARKDEWPGTDFDPAPRYDQIAQASYAHGERVEDPQDVRPALERGLAAVRDGQAAVVEIVVPHI